MGDAPLLVLDEVGHRPPEGPAVSGISLAVPRGATLALLGETGSGLATIGRIAAGLLRPDRGEVRFDGEPVQPEAMARSLRRRISMLFRDAHGSLDPRWTLRDSIAEPLRAFAIVTDDAAIEERVAQLLGLVGVPVELALARPDALDAAQAQRVAIARALACEPALLICHEPTSALDVTAQAQVLNVLSELQAMFGLTLLFITHDCDVARHMADLVAVLHQGRLVEFGPAASVFAAPRHPYARQLIAPDLRLERPVDGVAEAGCAYRPRCAMSVEMCAREAPGLRLVGDVAVACHAAAEDIA